MNKKDTIGDRIIRWVGFIVIAFILLFAFLGVMYVLDYLDGDNRSVSAYDEGWHIGIKQCTEYWNLTDNEQLLINQYRANRMEAVNK